MSNRYQEAERAVIAHLITEPSSVSRVAARLSHGDFSTELYDDAFRVILESYEQGKSFDIISLKAHGVEFPIGFLDILGVVGGAGDVESCIDLVEEGAFRQRVKKHGRRLESIAFSQDKPTILKTLGEFEKDFLKSPTMFDQTEAVEAYERSLERRRDIGAGVSWGYADMDDMLQPAVGGDMVVVAARPSVGKTALAENICDNWSYEAAYPVLFVSAEMRLSQLMDRAVSRVSTIPTQRLLRGILGPSDDEQVKEALNIREKFNITYIDDGRATTTSVRAAATSVRLLHGGLTGIIVDYIQLLADSGDNEYQRVTRISRALKSIAREFDVPLLALSQLSRTGQYRKDTRPRLEDIRDSGAIEQDADIVFGLYAPSDDVLECLVLKNRQGSKGTFYLNFDKDYVRMSDE